MPAGDAPPTPPAHDKSREPGRLPGPEAHPPREVDASPATHRVHPALPEPAAGPRNSDPATALAGTAEQHAEDACRALVRALARQAARDIMNRMAQEAALFTRPDTP